MKRKCAGITMSNTTYEYPCQNGATIKRGSKYFCWGHDPQGREKRLEAARKRKLLPHWRTRGPQC